MNTEQTKIYLFSELTHTQRIQLADALCSHYPFSYETTLVEYVLRKSLGDDDAPFYYSDITNNTPTGHIDINGISYELTQEEAKDKAEFYEYLELKAFTIAKKAEEKLESLKDDERDEYAERLEFFQENTEYRFEEIKQDLQALEFNNEPEIYQWLHCNDYIIRKLGEQGECTLDGTYWGRQHCGQSITSDCVIQKIAFDHFSEYGKNYITQDTFDTLDLGRWD